MHSTFKIRRLSIAGNITAILSLTIAALAGCGATSTESSSSARVAAADTVPTGGVYAPPVVHTAHPKGDRVYSPAFVAGTPGSTCTLYPEGNTDPSESLPAAIDEDGYARFQVVRPSAATDVARLVLDCTDPTGKATQYPVDLRADATYAPRPFDGSRTNFELRPALTGDPTKMTQGELIAGGYGLRPDPVGNPSGYQRWLTASQVNGYKLRSAKREVPKPVVAPIAKNVEQSVTINDTGLGAGWTGVVMNGQYRQNSIAALSYTYGANEATLTVPTTVPGAYGVGGTYLSIWNGLGETSAQLVQAEVWVTSGSSASTYFVHHQCFSNDGTSDPNSAHVGDSQDVTFTPSAGDTIFTEEWYCDATGNVNLQGGYACTHMVDVTQNAVWDCSNANSTSCASYQLQTADMAFGVIGTTAEFIMENDDGEHSGDANHGWPDFSSPVIMNGSALVLIGSNEQVDWVNPMTDTAITELTDFTSGVPLHNSITVSGQNNQVRWPSNQVGAPSDWGQVSWSTTPVGEIRGYGNKCYELPDFDTNPGTHPDYWDCNGGVNQQWTWTDMGQLVGEGGMCLDLPDFETAPGTIPQIWTCNGGTNQTWRTGPTNSITGLGGGCLDLPDWETADGTTPQYWTCNGGTNQSWTWDNVN